MSDILQRAAERVQDNMDEILTNFKTGAKITVLVRTPGKPTADFCMTDDDLAEVAAMVQRRQDADPARQTQMTGWRDMVSAPKDGTILHLLVRPGQEDLDPLTSFHDSREPYETIGFNQLSDTTIDEWQFAGWDWCQDCITDGHGDVIGWRPFGIATEEGQR